MTRARLAVVALALAANIGFYAVDETSGNEDILFAVFLVLSILAGLLVAHWWAVAIALSCPVLAVFVPTGTEDTRGFIIVIGGVLPGLWQAVFISVGVALAAIIHRRRAHARS